MQFSRSYSQGCYSLRRNLFQGSQWFEVGHNIYFDLTAKGGKKRRRKEEIRDNSISRLKNIIQYITDGVTTELAE